MASRIYPELRRNLRFVRTVQQGRVSIVVKDPVSMRYFKFGEMEAWLMQRMDGTRSIEDILAELESELGVKASPQALEVFVRRLKELGLAKRTQAERSLLVLEAVRKQRKLRLEGHGSTLFRMRFSFGDPDELFNRVIESLRLFWTPAFFAVSLLAFAFYAGVIVAHWDTFVQGVVGLYQPAQYTLGFIATLYVTFVVIAGIHELGHGLTCKHYGGEVHEMGAMLLYFTPAFFCNVNDAWTFENRAHRLWVTFAGGWVQLLVAAVGAAVWLIAEPGSLAHTVGFICMVVGGGLSVLLNYNPLIPLDGYYALMDWVEVPNLRGRSFEYLGAYLRRYVLRLNVQVPAVTPRERRIFLTYGLLAVVYTVSIIALIGYLVGAFLVARFGAWGWALVAIVLVLVFRKLGLVAVRLARVWWTEKRSFLTRGPVAVGTFAGLLAPVLLAFLVPWTIRVPGVAVVEPEERHWIRPADGGRIEAVYVSEGQRVHRGDTLLVLRSPELELERTATRAALASLTQQAAAARAMPGGESAARIAELAAESRRQELAAVEQRRDALVLRSHGTAIVATARPDELLGAYASPGDTLLELWGAGRPRVRVQLEQRNAGSIRPGTPLAVRFPATARHTWRTEVAVLSPAAREGWIELWSEPMPDGPPFDRMRAGMVGGARLQVRRTHVAGALYYAVQRRIRLDWFL